MGQPIVGRGISFAGLSHFDGPGVDVVAGGELVSCFMIWRPSWAYESV